MVDVPMLWTSLRLNWGNTLAVTAFCLLSVLGAASNGVVFNDRDDAGAVKARACNGSCYLDKQPQTAEADAAVAARSTAQLQFRAFTAD